MPTRVSVHTSVGKITKTTNGGYFSTARLAQNVRSFMNTIKRG